jgi:hypothetical protein
MEIFSLSNTPSPWYNPNKKKEGFPMTVSIPPKVQNWPNPAAGLPQTFMKVSTRRSIPVTQVEKKHCSST